MCLWRPEGLTSKRARGLYETEAPFLKDLNTNHSFWVPVEWQQFDKYLVPMGRFTDKLQCLYRRVRYLLKFYAGMEPFWLLIPFSPSWSSIGSQHFCHSPSTKLTLDAPPLNTCCTQPTHPSWLFESSFHPRHLESGSGWHWCPSKVGRTPEGQYSKLLHSADTTRLFSKLGLWSVPCISLLTRIMA